MSLRMREWGLVHPLILVNPLLTNGFLVFLRGMKWEYRPEICKTAPTTSCQYFHFF